MPEIDALAAEFEMPAALREAKVYLPAGFVPTLYELEGLIDHVVSSPAMAQLEAPQHLAEVHVELTGETVGCSPVVRVLLDVCSGRTE